MRRYNLLIAGLLMVGAGAYLIFTNPQALPLWFVWLAGPFLWYVGIAVSISGIAINVFIPGTARQKAAVGNKQRQQREIPVLHMRKLGPQGPMGLVREIPAMGGFIM